MDRLTELTQAILLLTSDFLKDKDPKISPLNAEEWGLFSKWLYDNELSPLNLLEVGFEEKLATWSDETISLDRIKLLMNRGVALALTLEKWQQMGIWVITKATDDKKYYPKRLKDVCKHNAPPILYGVGNKNILNRVDTVAFCTNETLSNEEMKYLELLGKNISDNGYVLIVSEIDKKNDQLIDGALGTGGDIIIIVSNDLLGAALNKRYRNALMHSQLVIISPYYPEAGVDEQNKNITNSYYNALASLSLGFSKHIQSVPVMEDESNASENVSKDTACIEEQKPKQGTFDL